MRIPGSSVFAARQGAPAALLAGIAAASLTFIATPYLIPEIAKSYGVPEGTAGVMSVAQVGAFALATLAIPRLVAPSGTMMRTAAAFLIALNTLSAFQEVFWILVALRTLAGFAAGVITWIAWSDAMRSRASMAGIAAAGPLMVLIGSPVMALVSDSGAGAIYLILGVLTIPAAALRCDVTGERRRKGEVSRSRSNRVLLAALFLLTFSGSSLSVNLVIVGRDIHGLSPLATSAAFSLDAVTSLAGARLASRHRKPGLWLSSAGIAAALTVVGPAPLFFFALAWWGFAFWMAVPGIFAMLSDRSLEPAERAGDAQGLMALGRALGHAMGGAFVNADALAPLALVAGIGMSTSGVVVIAVHEGRSRLPPSDPGTIARISGR